LFFGGGGSINYEGGASGMYVYGKRTLGLGEADQGKRNPFAKTKVGR